MSIPDVWNHPTLIFNYQCALFFNEVCIANTMSKYNFSCSLASSLLVYLPLDMIGTHLYNHNLPIHIQNSGERQLSTR
jgi:hypothetical protein